MNTPYKFKFYIYATALTKLAVQLENFYYHHRETWSNRN